MTDTSLQLQDFTFLNLTPLQGGRNNRVYHALNKSDDVLIKQYFYSVSDTRDRLSSEYLMLSFLHRQGITNVPRPLLSDVATHTGVYQFIKGSPVNLNTITENDVVSFSELLNRMWQFRNTPQAQHLPIASEACFSIKEYVDKIKNRFALFSQLPSNDSVTKKMSSFVDDNLSVFFNKLVSQVESSGSTFTNLLNPRHRTLSPSDHGFHNAIRGNDGNLYFIDFEYAGWDDPVKMICDCFLQPDKPVPEKFHLLFLKNCKQIIDPIDNFVSRIKYIYPLLGLKWCLIMLNEFLPVSESRRQFAGKNVGNDLRIIQLERSINSFDRIHEQFNENYIVNMIKNSV